MTPLLAAVLALAAADDVKYAKPELLIEPAELKKPAVRDKYVLLDARRKAEYLLGHAPNARWIDHPNWARAFNRGEGQAVWARAIGDLGIDTSTPVIVYDNVQNKDAARIWWILKYWGVKDVRLINGGWRGYVGEGGSVTREDPLVKPARPELSEQAGRLTTMDELVKAVKEHLALKEKNKEVKDSKLSQLIDARTEEEYCGDQASATRNGTIPTAKNLDWAELIDKKTGRFKSAKDLAEVFAKAKIDPSKPTTAFCQSGGRSSVMAFVVELMSGNEVRNYYGGWNEWGNVPVEKQVPVEKPKRKPK